MLHLLLLHLLLLTHLEKLVGVHAAGLLCHAHAHKAHHGAVFVLGRRLHGCSLCAHHMGSRHGRIAEGGVALQLFDHSLVFLRGLYAGDAKGNNLQAAQIPPLGAEHFVERLRQLHGVAGQRRVADAHFGDLGKGRLQSRHQLGLKLAVNGLTGVAFGHVAADVLIEQHGVADAVGILAEAADGNVHIQTDVIVHHPEWYGAGGAVLVADELLGIEVIHPLILGRLAAEGETPAQRGKGLLQAITKVAGENRRLRGGVVCKLARFGAQLGNPSLIDDDHALAVGHGDDGAVGDNVVRALGVGGAARDTLLPLDCQNVFRQRLTVKVLFPLVGQNASGRTKCSFYKTHS